MFKSLATQLTPNNEGILVAFLIWLFGINWKTSLSGFLSLGIATFGTLTAFIPLLQPFIQTKWPLVIPIVTAILTLLSGLGKAWVGLLMQDAGQQAVKLPDVAEPVAVAAHEIPNQPLPAGAKIAKG